VDIGSTSERDQCLQAEFCNPGAPQVVQSRLSDLQPPRGLGLADFPSPDPLSNGNTCVVYSPRRAAQ
jgi:hypothetical protein